MRQAVILIIADHIIWRIYSALGEMSFNSDFSHYSEVTWLLLSSNQR